MTYQHSGRKLAVLTIGRDHDSLAAEIESKTRSPLLDEIASHLVAN